MDRLSTLDAEFLHLKDSIAHMHVLASGASRSIEQLCQHALARLAKTPPGRSRSDKSA